MMNLIWLWRCWRAEVLRSPVQVGSWNLIISRVLYIPGYLFGISEPSTSDGFQPVGALAFTFKNNKILKRIHYPHTNQELANKTERLADNYLPTRCFARIPYKWLALFHHQPYIVTLRSNGATTCFILELLYGSIVWPGPETNFPDWPNPGAEICMRFAPILSGAFWLFGGSCFCE